LLAISHSFFVERFEVVHSSFHWYIATVPHITRQTRNRPKGGRSGRGGGRRIKMRRRKKDKDEEEEEG